MCDQAPNLVKASSKSCNLQHKGLQQAEVNKQPMFAGFSALEPRHGASQTLGSRQLPTQLRESTDRVDQAGENKQVSAPVTHTNELTNGRDS